jgi:Beta-lactamase superfamily domain
MADSDLQLELNRFLQCELYHSLGSYDVAVQRLRALRRRIERRRENLDAHSWEGLVRPTDLDATIEFNEALRDLAHKPADLRDDLSQLQRDAGGGGYLPPRYPAPSVELRDTKDDPSSYSWVIDFYQTSIYALKSVTSQARLSPERRSLDASMGDEDIQRELGLRLAFVHDPQRRIDDSLLDADSEATYSDALKGRITRNMVRRKSACKRIAQEDGKDRARLIFEDHLRARAGDAPAALHTYVIQALVDAHMRMHYAEHLLSHNFRDKIRFRDEINREADKHLQLSIVLNTFVYVVGRKAPWIFGEDDQERREVLECYQHACDTLTPTYCVWLGQQAALLALQRRAYARSLLSSNNPSEITQAYRDYYKLKRLIRGLGAQFDARVSRPPGATTFLDGLHMLAELHTGHLYREAHAYGIALRHFDRSYTRLQRLSREPDADEEDVRQVIRNARWRTHLLVNQGKSYYELGRVAGSLLCYTRAWKAFLELANTESHALPNVDVIDGLLAWLESIQDEPDVNKQAVRERFEPLVDLFSTLSGPAHLRLLAAEIMLRLGHVLFILKLPPREDGDTTEKATPPRIAIDDSLAQRCLVNAARLDRYNLLIGTDLLNIKRRKCLGRPQRAAGRANARIEHPAEREAYADPLAGQRLLEGRPWIDALWAGGGGEFEEAARVIEYVLQLWLAERDAEALSDASARSKQVATQGDEDEWIARELLESFLIHTDTSNVKLAQVYRYLMPEPTRHRSVERDLAPMLELVCMRRYSSFFPFLPRPSAFRVLGGGYFIRVYDAPEPSEGDRPDGAHLPPFGIVVDPGPDYLENLYRCELNLADIDMVILTHDHADHIAALDALLALLGYRGMLEESRFKRDRNASPGKDDSTFLTIVGNDSVVRRYGFFNERQPAPEPGKRSRKRRKDAVQVLSFNEFAQIAADESDTRRAAIPHLPRTLRVTPVRAATHTDAHGHLAEGFLVSVGETKQRSTVLFTSDTGREAMSLEGLRKRRFKARSQQIGLTEAVRAADVIVAHLSSTPLPELRELAGMLDEPDDTRAKDEMTAFKALWQRIYEQQDTREQDKDHFQLGRTFLLRQLQFGFRTRGERGKGLTVSPLHPRHEHATQQEKHLFLGGVLEIARAMSNQERQQLLLIGELRQELGSFRTRIAHSINTVVWNGSQTSRALTADIGLKVRLTKESPRLCDDFGLDYSPVQVRCSTCALDNDLVDVERFHKPVQIHEVCVKGEDEGIFYNCLSHDPQRQRKPVWVEEVERLNLFGP